MCLVCSSDLEYKLYRINNMNCKDFVNCMSQIQANSALGEINVEVDRYIIAISSFQTSYHYFWILYSPTKIMAI